MSWTFWEGFFLFRPCCHLVAKLWTVNNFNKIEVTQGTVKYWRWDKCLVIRIFIYRCYCRINRKDLNPAVRQKWQCNTTNRNNGMYSSPAMWSKSLPYGPSLPTPLSPHKTICSGSSFIYSQCYIFHHASNSKRCC